MSVPDLNMYFGRPGQLRELFDPVGGALATRNLGTVTFQTGAGGARVQRALDGTRQYSLNYAVLGRANFDWFESFRQGHFGVGPFMFIDPGRRNALNYNQSSATSATNDTRQFTVSGAGGTLSSVASLATPFPRVLAWNFATTTPASAQLVLDKPSSVWPGIPVYPRPYTFWMMVLGGGSTVDFQLRFEWMALDGSVLSTVNSSTVTSSLTVWQMVMVRALTPPSNACWARLSVNPTVATIATGDILYMSSLMLNEGDGPDSQWAPGTGIFPVTILSMPEQYGFGQPDMLVSPTLVLQEVK